MLGPLIYLQRGGFWELRGEGGREREVLLMRRELRVQQIVMGIHRLKVSEKNDGRAA